ncbi:MAG TPA: aspartate/glutamate racemase family protein [Stellaceae bacterium]|nr:aspartate/glutamate racemase family protein [Stellaceae bacterium]
MSRLLLVNPNSSAAVSRGLLAAALPLLPAGSEVVVVTAGTGPEYIGDRETMRLGAAAALAAISEKMASDAAFDGILLCCFADLGTDAVREHSGLPASNLLDASLALARCFGPRFSIVTAGQQWQGLLPDMVAPRLNGGCLAAIHTLPATGTEIAGGIDEAIADLGLRSHAADRVQSIIVGGAGLAGRAKVAAARVAVPVIDSLHAGILVLQALIAAYAGVSTE